MQHHSRMPWFEGLMTDVRLAARTLRKNASFTTVAIAMLGLGIGINAMVFTVTDTVLFRGFPLVADNERLVYLTSGRGCCVSYPDYADWRAQAASFTDLALVHGIQQTFSDRSGVMPETLDSTEVTANTFGLVGQRPLLGRDFTNADATAGAARVAILRYTFWETRYAKDPSIVGRTIRLNGVPTTVIGVMPRGFSFPQNQDIWVPLVTTPDVLRRDNRETWFVLGRLKDGVALDAARAEIETISRRLADAYPATNDSTPPLLSTFDEFFIGARAAMIYRAMMAAVALVLIIACANLANLQLARAISGSRDLSVRIAIGASRWRIVRQLLVESVLLSSLGGVVGWWVAQVGIRLFTLTASGASLSDQITGTWFDRMLDYSLDARAFAYLVATSIGTGLLFGLVPALRLSRLDINATLKDGSRGATEGGPGKRLSSLLVVGEVALAVVLLTGAGVMIRSFLNVYGVDFGFNADRIVATLVALPAERYPDVAAQTAFYDRLRAGVATLPGVEAVAYGSLPDGAAARVAYEMAGTPPVENARRPTLVSTTIGAGYFSTLGVPLISGREFSDDDRPSTVVVAVVNQKFVDIHWPDADPLGQRLRLFRGPIEGPWLTVVGVVPTMGEDDPLRPDANALVYLPFRQQQTRGAAWMLARTTETTVDLTAAIRREMQTLDSSLPIQLGPVRLPERYTDRYQYRGVSGALFLLCASMALLLASVGLYAVVAHSVSMRTAEIGLRIAIGGTGRDILTLVFREGARPLAIGLVAGIAAAMVLLPALTSVLIEVSPADPLTFGVASATLMAAALFGCWIPARRAMRVDPVVALRT